MVLVDLDREGIHKKRRALSYMTFDYNFDNDIEIRAAIRNKDFFYKWIRGNPYYNNVINEGIKLYVE